MIQLGRKPFDTDAERLQVQGRADAQAQTPHVIQAVINKYAIADNVATPIFTVTTTDETGSDDAGVYLVVVEGLISHGAGSSGSVNTAVKRFRGAFSRAMCNAGTGALSAVTEDADDTLIETDAAARSIGNVTLTVAETSEYLTTASITVDLAGSSVATAQLLLTLTLYWLGFLTPPLLAPA